MATFNCPQNHQWPAPTVMDPNDPTWKGRCPTCGELIALDCPAFKTSFAGCVVVLLLVGLAFGGIVVSTVVLQVDETVTQIMLFAFVFLCVIVAVIVAGIQRRKRRERLKLLSEMLGYSHSDTAERDRRLMLRIFPFIAENTSGFSGNEIFGVFEGSAFYMVDFARTVQKRGQKPMTATQTVIAYLNEIPNLPDFVIEPTAVNRSKSWNQDMWVVLGLRKPKFDPLAGDHFDVKTEEPEKLVEIILSCRDWLNLLSGWQVESSGGRMLFFRQMQVIDAELLPAFLAITWRFRQLFAAPERTNENFDNENGR